MTSASRDRVNQALRLASNGPAGRELPLRILIVHSDAAGVELSSRRSVGRISRSAQT